MKLFDNNFALLSLELIKFLNHLLQVFRQSDLFLFIQQHCWIFCDVKVNGQRRIFRYMSERYCVSKVSGQNFVNCWQLIFISKIQNCRNFLIFLDECIPIPYFFQIRTECFDKRSSLNEKLTLRNRITIFNLIFLDIGAAWLD